MHCHYFSCSSSPDPRVKVLFEPAMEDISNMNENFVCDSGGYNVFSCSVTY